MTGILGKILGHYQVIEALNVGKAVVVYKARDLQQQRYVSLMALPQAAKQEMNFAARFAALAVEAERLNHPGLARVYDAIQKDGNYFLVSEFIPGETLSQLLGRLRRKGCWLPFSDSLGLVIQVSRACEYAIANGGPARQVSTDCIYIRPEPLDDLPFCAVLIDPGMGSLGSCGEEGGSPLTSSRGQHQSDQLRQLSMLLYELVTGTQIPSGTLEDGSFTESGGLPKEIVSVLSRANLKREKDRIQTAAELVEALAKIDAQVTQSAQDLAALGRPESLMAAYLESLFEEPMEPMEAAQYGEKEDSVQVIGPGVGTLVVPLRREGITVGRVAGNDIVLNDLLVSRLHARIRYDDELKYYVVIDLNSTNGTFLGGEKLLPGVEERWIPETPLRVGDTVLRLLSAG